VGLSVALGVATVVGTSVVAVCSPDVGLNVSFSKVATDEGFPVLNKVGLPLDGLSVLLSKEVGLAVCSSDFGGVIDRSVRPEGLEEGTMVSSQT